MANFTGRATYDTGVFEEGRQDVSAVIGIISPYETPALNLLGNAPYQATNVIHQWTEDALSPNTFVSSSTIPESTTATSVQVAAGLAAYIQAGAILLNESAGERLIVTAISGNWLTLSRAMGGTTVAAVAAGSTFRILDGAAKEGESVNGDYSRARSTQNNLCQIIKKDIIVSGTQEAILKYGSIQGEYAYQQGKRIREALRDLEKFALMGIGSQANTLGSATVPRQMNGAINMVSTNVTTVTTFTETSLRTALRSCFDAGGEIDVIVCDNTIKETIDDLNSSRVRVDNGETTYANFVTDYRGTYGTQGVVMSRWMPTNSALFLDSSRVKVLPLVGRSFFHKAEGGAVDATKGAVIGEYTLELMNEDGMAYVYKPQ